MSEARYLRGKQRQLFVVACIWFILGLTSFSNHPSWGRWITVGSAIVMVITIVFAKRKNN